MFCTLIFFVAWCTICVADVLHTCHCKVSTERERENIVYNYEPHRTCVCMRMSLSYHGFIVDGAHSTNTTPRGSLN